MHDVSFANEIMISDNLLTLIKFADDMALVARLKDEASLSRYFPEIEFLCSWFKDSFLTLNVNKTKELVFYNCRAPEKTAPVIIDKQQVETVSSFRYLGSIIDQKLNFRENTDIIYKKAHQRLFILRKLRSFNVSTTVLVSVYRCCIESILTFNIVSWFGHISVRDKTRLTKIVNISSKIVGTKLKDLAELYNHALRRKGLSILRDPSHPLNDKLHYLPSGRRLLVPRARKNIFKKSFIPSAVAVLNMNLAHSYRKSRATPSSSRTF